MNKRNFIILILLFLCSPFYFFGQCSSDITPPVAICQNIFASISPGGGNTIIHASQINNGSSDNCGIASLTINGGIQDTFDCSNLGANFVTFVATDTAGNTDTCVAVVTVGDITPPVSMCVPSPINFYLNQSSQVVVTPFDIGFATDNCGIGTMLVNNMPFVQLDITNIGLNMMTFRAIDLAGNSSQCNAFVNVIDTTTPNSNAIRGNIFRDLNSDCINNGETNLQNILVQATSSTQTFYGLTDTSGNYFINTDTGYYTVTPHISNVYWQSCPGSYSVYIDSTSNADTLDFGFQIIVECPFLDVQISAPFLRRAQASHYNVSYCNTGTADAMNATVQVELDPFLTFVSSNSTLINQNGNILTFDIGNVAMNDCGDFTIFVNVSASAILGQTHCTEAHIYPDSICISNLWSGAQLLTEANCIVDSISFKIRNIGTGPYSPDVYNIFEDHVMMHTGSTGTILPNDSIIITIPANQGKTYRIEVPQPTGFPSLLGSPVAAAGVEGCVPFGTGLFNIGFINQFSNNNSSPFVSVDCQPNIGSFDPNDKTAQPEGYDANFHYIYDYTSLDYRIRFQNTGTDTAFLVVVRDTISPYLDITSLKMGPSSHAYTWKIYGQGILEVSFNNIMLPDSNVNEPNSHGFFSYEIQQKPNNPNGAVINNTAAIYFDNNAPVITNTTWHTVGDNFVVLSIEPIQEANTPTVKVYPNPFTISSTLEIEGKEYQELQLTVYDLTGRELAQERSYNTNKVQISRGNLQQGIYFYKLEGDGKLVNKGKIVVN